MRAALKPILKAHEAVLINSGQLPSYPPTFIVGAPRAGTTVAYQLVTSQLRTSYICNFAESFPASPAAATRLIRDEIRRHHSDFTSRYGHTKHRAGPSEGYAVWQQWFRWTQQGGAYIERNAQKQARGTIAALECMLDGPFVNKDPHHSGRISLLNKVFPDCLFVWIRRDPLEAAQSLLTARRLSPRKINSLPREQVWWGYRPRAYETIKNNPYIDQVCQQVYCTECDILDGLRNIKPDNKLSIRYEDLCSNPQMEVRQIMNFIRGAGVSFHPTRYPLPEMNVKHNWWVSNHELSRMRNGINKLYASPLGNHTDAQLVHPLNTKP